MKLRLSFDTAAVGLLLVIATFIGVVIFIGEQAGVRVRVTGVNGAILLVQPVA